MTETVPQLQVSSIHVFQVIRSCILAFIGELWLVRFLNGLRHFGIVSQIVHTVQCDQFDAGNFAISII